jgi:hypothetical protein
MNVNVLALARNVTLKGILNGPKDRFEEMLEVWEKNSIKPVVDKGRSRASLPLFVRKKNERDHIGGVQFPGYKAADIVM